MDEDSHKNLGKIRREYKLRQLDEGQLPSEPMGLFKDWLEEARASGTPDPTAMTLSTVNKEGKPSSRMVLLKKIEEDRLVFFTNLRSKKAREISIRTDVAAHFYWPQLERQIKISGTTVPLEDAESDHYFQSRPFESQVAAWASPQSEIVPDREALEKEYGLYLEKFKGLKQIPRPPFWGGIAIRPNKMEFWQGGKFRLHDRFEYSLGKEGWIRVRLAP